MSKSDPLTHWSSFLHVSLEPSLKKKFRTEPLEKFWITWCTSLRERTENLSPPLFPQLREPKISVSSDVFSLEDAMRILTGAGSIVRKPFEYEPGEWIENCENFLKIAQDASVIDPEENPLLHQLLAGELGWFLGTVLSDWKPARLAVVSAKKAFADGFETILDGGGLPKPQFLSVHRELLASWTRVLELGRIFDSPPWRTNIQREYEWSVLQALRLARKDGTQVFTAPPGTDPVAEKRTSNEFARMMEKAVMLDSDENDRNLALVILPGRRTIDGKKREDVLEKPLPEETYVSDSSQFACMRTAWQFSEPALYVRYGDIVPEMDDFPLKIETLPFGGWTDRAMQIELSHRGQTLWCGAWHSLVKLNGKTLSPLEPWSENCTIRESSHTYMELELPLEQDRLIQRHILFMNEEKIVFLADSIVCSTPPKEGEMAFIEYEAGIPVNLSIEVRTDPEANELLFCAKKGPILRACPIALPEWKQHESTGEFTFEENSIRLRMHVQGNSLFTPLIFDLNSARLNKPYTWRKLTVGENLEIVPDDIATGYRVQFAKDQFLIYRSLVPPANRTFLGHNLVSDFLFARFEPEKGVESILEIEESH